MQIEVLQRPKPQHQAVLICLGMLPLACVEDIIPPITTLLRGKTETPLSGHERTLVLFLAAALSLAFGALLVKLLRTREYQLPGMLSLESDAIRWQPAGQPATVLSYRDLWSVSPGRHGRNAFLALRGVINRPDILLLKTALAQPALAETLIEDILCRVETLPEGQELRRKLERRREISDQLSSGRQTISFVIAAGLFAVLVLKIVFVLGAFANPILAGNGFPLLMSILGFLLLGSFLELLLGRERFLTVLLASSLAGAAASPWLGGDVVSAGAWAGLSGLFGAGAFILWRRSDQLPFLVAKTPPLELTFFVFLLLSPLLNFRAHLVGFVAGFLLMALTTPKGNLIGLHTRLKRAA
jgi:membrane associated rhomboid family serine protease